MNNAFRLYACWVDAPKGQSRSIMEIPFALSYRLLFALGASWGFVKWETSNSLPLPSLYRQTHAPLRYQCIKPQDPHSSNTNSSSAPSLKSSSKERSPRPGTSSCSLPNRHPASRHRSHILLPTLGSPWRAIYTDGGRLVSGISSAAGLGATGIVFLRYAAEVARPAERPIVVLEARAAAV